MEMRFMDAKVARPGDEAVLDDKTYRPGIETYKR